VFVYSRRKLVCPSVPSQSLVTRMPGAAVPPAVRHHGLRMDKGKGGAAAAMPGASADAATVLKDQPPLQLRPPCTATAGTPPARFPQLISRAGLAAGGGGERRLPARLPAWPAAILPAAAGLAQGVRRSSSDRAAGLRPRTEPCGGRDGRARAQRWQVRGCRHHAP